VNNKITQKWSVVRLGWFESLWIEFWNLFTEVKTDSNSKQVSQLYLNDILYYQNVDKSKVDAERISLMDKLTKESNESINRKRVCSSGAE